jgi:hypothetical protein
VIVGRIYFPERRHYALVSIVCPGSYGQLKQRYAPTWNTLEHHEEYANKAKHYRAKDDALDEENLPPLKCYAEIEYAERDLETDSNKYIHYLVQITVLQKCQHTRR